MRTLIALFVAALIAPLAAHGEKVDTHPAGLRKGSTNVIVGEVKAIYIRTAIEGRHRVTRHMAEVPSIYQIFLNGAIAMCPAMVNFQVAGGHMIVPAPFGPRDPSTGATCFRSISSLRLPVVGATRRLTRQRTGSMFGIRSI